MFLNCLKKQLSFNIYLAYHQGQEPAIPQLQSVCTVHHKAQSWEDVTALSEASGVVKVHYISSRGKGKQCQLQCKLKQMNEATANET